MDAIELLKTDHDKVNALFRQFEQGGNAQEFKMMFDQLNRELTLHTEIEENIFYPAVRSHPDTNALVEESYKEHGEAKMLLTEIAGLDNTSAEWGQKMTQLMRAIQQHVQEEEGQLFPRVRQLMGEEQIMQLGQQMQQAKSAAKPALQDLGQQKMMYEQGGQSSSYNQLT